MYGDIYVSPAEIGFSQDSIARRFYCGRVVNDAVSSIRYGSMRATDFPTIDVVKLANGKFPYYSVDNRRLYVFRVLYKLGYLQRIPVNVVDFSNYSHARKFTTFNEGQSICVRGSYTQDNEVVLLKVDNSIDNNGRNEIVQEASEETTAEPAISERDNSSRNEIEQGACQETAAEAEVSESSSAVIEKPKRKPSLRVRPRDVYFSKQDVAEDPERWERVVLRITMESTRFKLPTLPVRRANGKLFAREDDVCNAWLCAYRALEFMEGLDKIRVKVKEEEERRVGYIFHGPLRFNGQESIYEHSDYHFWEKELGELLNSFSL